MTYPTIWDVVLFVAVIAVFGMRYLLPAYLPEKGKNLASKEDLEELTRKVEGVKTQYLSELERLRFDLGQASLVHRAQYETEFRVYEEINMEVHDRRPADGLSAQADVGLHRSDGIR